MKILLLNQTFWPDVMASGQYLTELALCLVEGGHQVTVVTSERAYDHPNKCFVRRETWRGIEICRIPCTGFGKGAKWRRGADFASFMVSCCWRLLRLPRQDAVMALTSPPLISFLGCWLAKLRRCRFFYWVMDLNPDEAIAAGWLREDSWAAQVLERMSRFSLNQAEKIIALDRFMRERILAKGIEPGKIEVIPPWSQDDAVRYDAPGRERFRKAHGLEGKFVVMYSGNHSPCHPLDTLLDAAKRLAGEADIVFCFVGGGSEWGKMGGTTGPRDYWTTGPLDHWTAEQRDNGTTRGPRSGGPVVRWSSGPNFVCLPYQPLEQLAGSLSAADLHVVVMGEAFVGTIHPCKIYNILRVAAPVLYIGPRPSHISEILDQLGEHPLCGSARHGEVERVIEQIQRIKEKAGRREVFGQTAAQFSKAILLSRLVALLVR